MDPEAYKILDNPVWHALQTAHKGFALGTGTIKKYPADILPIFGCEDPAAAKLSKIEPWVAINEKLFIVGALPPVPANWKLEAKLDCVQMICPDGIQAKFEHKAEIVLLTEKDSQQMLELIEMVQPGYFYKSTPILGQYYGIKKDKQLVAMAGERLRITGFTEVSAVCTHPAHTGKGYAQQLVAHITTKNIEDEALPFLHVLTSNTRARKIYQLLGYSERKLVPFWRLTLNKYAG